LIVLRSRVSNKFPNPIAGLAVLAKGKKGERAGSTPGPKIIYDILAIRELERDLERERERERERKLYAVWLYAAWHRTRESCKKKICANLHELHQFPLVVVVAAIIVVVISTIFWNCSWFFFARCISIVKNMIWGGHAARAHSKM
jgi:hypothetical protein